MKILKYIYYKLYKWSIITWGKDKEPHINAVFILTVTIFMNFTSIIATLDIFIHLEILNNKFWSKERTKEFFKCILE